MTKVSLSPNGAKGPVWGDTKPILTVPAGAALWDAEAESEAAVEAAAELLLLLTLFPSFPLLFTTLLSN